MNDWSGSEVNLMFKVAEVSHLKNLLRSKKPYLKLRHFDGLPFHAKHGLSDQQSEEYDDATNMNK